MKRLATSINSTSNQQSDNSNKIAKVDVDTFMEQHGHKNLSPALAEFLLSQSRLHDQERIRQKQCLSALPYSLVLSILEFVEILLNQVSAFRHVIGRFAADPTRTPILIFSSINLHDSIPNDLGKSKWQSAFIMKRVKHISFMNLLSLEEWASLFARCNLDTRRLVSISLSYRLPCRFSTISDTRINSAVCMASRYFGQKLSSIEWTCSYDDQSQNKSDLSLTRLRECDSFLLPLLDEQNLKNLKTVIVQKQAKLGIQLAMQYAPDNLTKLEITKDVANEQAQQVLIKFRTLRSLSVMYVNEACNKQFPFELLPDTLQHLNLTIGTGHVAKLEQLSRLVNLVSLELQIQATDESGALYFGYPEEERFDIALEKVSKALDWIVKQRVVVSFAIHMRLTTHEEMMLAANIARRLNEHGLLVSFVASNADWQPQHLLAVGFDIPECRLEEVRIGVQLWEVNTPTSDGIGIDMHSVSVSKYVCKESADALDALFRSVLCCQSLKSMYISGNCFFQYVAIDEFVKQCVQPVFPGIVFRTGYTRE